MKAILRFLFLLPLLLSLHSCALGMAFWRDETKSPPSIKTEKRPTQQPVLKIDALPFARENPRKLSLLIQLDQEFEQRERLVIEHRSEPSLWGSTLGTSLSLGILIGGLWLDQKSHPSSVSKEIGPWGWASLVFLGADLVLSLFTGETQTRDETLNESPWKPVLESPGKALYLRKARLWVADSDWQSETLTDTNGHADFDLSKFPKHLLERRHLALNLEVIDPIYGPLQTKLNLPEQQIGDLRMSFGQLPPSIENLISPPQRELEPIPITTHTHSGLAIVIGNQDYRQAPASQFALHDAEMVKRYSQSALGFQAKNTISINNGSKADLEAVFGNREESRSQMADWHTPNTPLLIYYSGHGAATLAGKSFLLPVDANPNYLASSGYALDTLYQNLAKLNYSELTVIIDACFSGMTPDGPLLPDRKPLVLESNKHSLPRLNKALLLHASNSHEMSVWWREKEHSLFTFYLLKGLQGEANANKDPILTAQELQHYLQTEVPKQARRLLGAEQNPVFWGDVGRILIKYPLP